ncbi:MAG: 3-ketoacyl-CoA thiolase [Thaumarchaeota archaeon]|nr:3-ketoacyl-CoA thiolase [Candidatus Calditenuaceae archaeon]MDW8042463.1 beta-ketoacyl synthase N-terminal-like domain-containing protein [Nitrososphaerota archaeon]
MRRVAVADVGITKFGVREASWKDLVQEAWVSLLQRSPNLDPRDIDSLFVGSAQPERFVYQSHVAPLVAELLGIRVSKMMARTEAACASGQAAIRFAWSTIAAGLSDVALVVGVEKMNNTDMLHVQSSMIDVADREFDGVNGLTAPPFFAMVAQRHMVEYGTTEEQLALVRVKSSHYSTHNPYAQFQKELSVDDVLNSKMVSPPLKLYDCSAITDGAVVALLVSEDIVRKYTDAPVWIVGGVQRCNSTNSINSLSDFTQWHSLREAANDLYRTYSITPNDLDFAEVHDCFTISEIMIYEELGLCKKGEGGKFIEEGQSHIGGTLPVNPSGGLLSNGHPLGATGLRQLYEAVVQMRGEVPRGRLVNGAELALAHNLSGMAVAHHLMLYSLNKR